MRRILVTTVAAAALVAAGCGDDDSGTAQQEQPAAQSQEANPGATAESLAARTQRLADQIAAAARTLAENPDANVDQRLSAAEERARKLSKRVDRELEQRRPDLAIALRDANDRLAAAAAELQKADGPADVEKVLDDKLGLAAEKLSDAAQQARELTGVDADHALEQASDQIEKLHEELPELTR